MSRRTVIETSLPAESIAEATGLPVSNVRAALMGDDVPVSDAVKVGGFLRLTTKEVFA